MKSGADAVILGAGIVGLSTERRLAERGAVVTVLDALDPRGWGSRAAAGVAVSSVRLWAEPDLHAFARASRAALAGTRRALGVQHRAPQVLGPVPSRTPRL